MTSPYERDYHERLGYHETQASQRNYARLDLLRTVKPTGSLLEVGCGMGGFLRLAAQHFHVEGVDVSAYAIRAAQQHLGSRVRQADLTQAPLPAASYDVLVAFNILEHLTQPAEIIPHLYEALAPAGALIGSVPLNAGPVGRVVTWVGNRIDRTHVSSNLSPRQWQQLFQAAGFGRVQLFGEIPLGRNRCHYVRGGWWPQVSCNLMFICEK